MSLVVGIYVNTKILLNEAILWLLSFVVVDSNITKWNCSKTLCFCNKHLLPVKHSTIFSTRYMQMYGGYFKKQKFETNSNKVPDPYKDNLDPYTDIIDDFGYLSEEDSEMLEILNTFTDWIETINDLTFYEKTFIVMNRKKWTAQDLADDAEVGKTMVSLVRKNPLTNKKIAKRLIQLCEDIGLQCPKERAMIEMG